MRFKVPQFIDIEDKIFGPFTFKQFMYLGGGVGLSYIAFRTLPLFAAVFVIVLVMALALSLTFWRINNKPFIFTLQAAIQYVAKPKMYLWSKERADKESDKRAATINTTPAEPTGPRLNDSRLNRISWGLNVINEE
jgi:hypothetical protein